MSEQEKSPQAQSPLLGTEALAAVESPLAGVNPRSLDALMAEDVAKLSEPEFDQVVLAMRKLRKAWAENEGVKAAAEAAGVKAPRQARAKGPKVSVNLNDLFGDS